MMRVIITTIVVVAINEPNMKQEIAAGVEITMMLVTGAKLVSSKDLFTILR
jgi:hypothetical protein|tara:strand:- start:730 stop:882 length:153 start_codon:yes stop_codon:yes gene_type:complete